MMQVEKCQAVLGQIQTSLDSASKCGAMQVGVAKGHLDQAFKGFVILQKEFIQAIGALQTQVAKPQGGNDE